MSSREFGTVPHFVYRGRRLHVYIMRYSNIDVI